MKKSLAFSSQFAAFWRTEFPNFSSTMVKKSVNLEHFGNTEFQRFLRPRRRNHLRFWVNLQHLEGLNFKISFNHGEEIPLQYVLSQFGIFGMTEFQNFIQPRWTNVITGFFLSQFSSTMDVVYSWIFLQIPMRENCSSREKISWNFLKLWPGKPGNLLEFH